MDVLTDVLESLRLTSSVYCRSQLGAPWLLRFVAHPTAVVHIVERGEAHLRLPGAADTVRLLEGDLLLLPHGTAHTVASLDGRRTPAAQVPSILMRAGDACRDERWSDAPSTVLICGTFGLEHHDHPLLSLLPNLIHVRADTPWLETARLLGREAAEARPGTDLVMRRLADVLLIQTIRHWLEREDAAGRSGWLAALRDPRMTGALEAIHAQPETAWTVASLAGRVRLSRAAFAARFRALVGEPPLAYLTRWRMGLASRLLRQSRLPMLEVANRVGYDSEAAFHRAFKRATGSTPGAYRRRSRLEHAGSAPSARD